MATGIRIKIERRTKDQQNKKRMENRPVPEEKKSPRPKYSRRLNLTVFSNTYKLVGVELHLPSTLEYLVLRKRYIEENEAPVGSRITIEGSSLVVSDVAQVIFLRLILPCICTSIWWKILYQHETYADADDDDGNGLGPRLPFHFIVREGRCAVHGDGRTSFFNDVERCGTVWNKDCR